MNYSCYHSFFLSSFTGRCRWVEVHRQEHMRTGRRCPPPPPHLLLAAGGRGSVKSCSVFDTGLQVLKWITVQINCSAEHVRSIWPYFFKSKKNMLADVRLSVTSCSLCRIFWFMSTRKCFRSPVSRVPSAATCSLTAKLLNVSCRFERSSIWGAVLPTGYSHLFDLGSSGPWVSRWLSSGV
jgi:hypothetical protein